MLETTFNPDFFVPSDIENAKNIILTPEDSDITSRWELETKGSVDMIDLFMDIGPDSVVLDWGCGIGRMSKALIDKYGCRVVGVDLQPKMLEYAKQYVNDDKFEVLQLGSILYDMPKDVFTHTLACWVFQHSNRVHYEIPLIYQSMKENGKAFILECNKKAIPNQAGGYFDDNVSTKVMLEKFFDLDSYGKIPLQYTTKKIRDMSWYAVLTKRYVKG